MLTKLDERILTLCDFAHLSIDELAVELDERMSTIRERITVLERERYITNSRTVAFGWVSTDRWDPDGKVGGRSGPHGPKRTYGDHLDSTNKYYKHPQYVDVP